MKYMMFGRTTYERIEMGIPARREDYLEEFPDIRSYINAYFDGIAAGINIIRTGNI